jgi:hypothetical protein
MLADTGVVALDTCLCAGGDIVVAGARDGTVTLTVQQDGETTTYTAVLPGPVTAVRSLQMLCHKSGSKKTCPDLAGANFHA